MANERMNDEQRRDAIMAAVPESGEITYEELVSNLASQGVDIGHMTIQQLKNAGLLRTRLVVGNGERRHLVRRASVEV